MIVHRKSHRSRPRGFTITEAVVVVGVLVAVGALGMPRLTRAHSLSPDAQLRRDTEELRRAVMVYAAQHDNTPPGQPGGSRAMRPTGEAMVRQLTGWTDRDGVATARPNGVFRFGPYLRRIPVNAINGRDTFAVVSPGRPIDQATGEHGWLYQPSTLSIVPDVVGRDDRGVRYIDY